MGLEKELRVLHLNLPTTGNELCFGNSLSIYETHSDTVPPTRPSLLMMPLPKSQASKTCVCGGLPIQTTTTLQTSVGK